ncbi:MAG: hypothetical protein FWG64_06810 [Firmicutes bacterium]|nr:hypothetical protein [Bacillota bacterium]
MSKFSRDLKKMSGKNAKFLCPFCMSENSKNKILYYCNTCNTGVSQKMVGKVKCTNASCKDVGAMLTQRRCPNCKRVLNNQILDTPILPFSIVGVSNSGKTNYITVMLKELKTATGMLDIAVSHMDKDTEIMHRENVSAIYQEHKPPQSTQAGTTLPQIWMVRNNARQRGNETPAYALTIFDGAGEDHEQNLDLSSTVCKYIERSKVIFLMIDPLILSNIIKGGVVDSEIMQNSLGGNIATEKEASLVLDNVVNYIKAAKGIKATTILDIPVAVIFTKFDTILQHPAFGEQALIKAKSLNIRNGKLDTTEIMQIDAEIRHWLQEIGETAFINTLKANFKEFYFFGVSSFGQPPINAFTLPTEINPHRVLDPILWLLNKADFID